MVHTVISREIIIGRVRRACKQYRAYGFTHNSTDSETMKTAVGISRCSLLKKQYGSLFIILKGALVTELWFRGHTQGSGFPKNLLFIERKLPATGTPAG